MLPCKSALSNTMEKQYASMDSFLKRFDVPSRQMGFELITIEEFAVWKTVLRGELNQVEPEQLGFFRKAMNQLYHLLIG